MSIQMNSPQTNAAAMVAGTNAKETSSIGLTVATTVKQEPKALLPAPDETLSGAAKDEEATVMVATVDSSGNTANDFSPFLSVDEKKDYEEAVSVYGPLVEGKSKSLNALGIAFFMSRQLEKIVFIPEEGRFYRKNTKRGLWENLADDILCNELLEQVIRFFFRVESVHIGCKCTLNFAKNVIAHLTRFAAKPGFFARRPGEYVLHCQNVFLAWNPTTKSFEQHPLDDDSIRSRNQLSVEYHPESTASRFMRELLAPVLEPDEIEVMLQYFGQCLLGSNVCQKILFIAGLAGGGKSTAVNIIESILGRQNVTQLRTNCLHGWYETNRYTGKSLLSAKDAPADFLRNRGAYLLKALTGNDVLATEAKHSNTVHEITGDFNIIVVSNCNQPVLLQDDRDAWERRILSVRFKNVKPKSPVRDFDRILVSEEGSGILNEVLRRLPKVITAGIQASASQRQAINDLLDESESAKVFLRDCVEAITPPEGKSLRSVPENQTSEELYLSYLEYCKSRNWIPELARNFQQKLVDLMPALFQRFRVTDIKRDGGVHRGYYAVRMKSVKNDSAEK